MGSTTSFDGWIETFKMHHSASDHDDADQIAATLEAIHTRDIGYDDNVIRVRKGHGNTLLVDYLLAPDDDPNKTLALVSDDAHGAFCRVFRAKMMNGMDSDSFTGFARAMSNPKA